MRRGFRGPRSRRPRPGCVRGRRPPSTAIVAVGRPGRRVVSAGASLRGRDVGLALLVAVIWGVAFVITRIGLDAFTAPQLVALRFLIAAAPALLLPRPALPWRALVPVGLTLFAGQFLFQFFGIAGGMPPGLASVIVQTQALF